MYVPQSTTRSILVSALLLLSMCEGLRQLDAEEVFPFDDLGTPNPVGYAVFGSEDDEFANAAYNLGDINGDGLDDLIFGQSTYGPNGRAVVVFGDDDSSRTSMSVETAVESPNGFQIKSDITNAEFGYSFSSGNFNNDGKTDLLIGAKSTSEDGFVALIWGRLNDSWGDITVSLTMDSSIGVVYTTGVSKDYFGYSITTLGDFNGDDYDDFAVGAPYSDEPSTDHGRVYVVFGGPSLVTTILDETNSLQITGPFFSAYFGMSVATVDFNNDSKPDLVVGASFANGFSGRVYVILGTGEHTVGDIDMAEFVNGDTTGLYIDGDIDNRLLGISVSAGCDVNGDGFQDIIVGSYYGYSGITGIAAVLFGKASGYAELDVDTLTSDDGFVINIASTGDSFGLTVGCLGQLNDDTYDDYFISYFNEDSQRSVIVFYGKEEFGDSISVEDEQLYSKEVSNAYKAFNAGNHLGETTNTTAFISKHVREFSGSAFVVKEFPSIFITQSPTTSPTVSPTTSPTLGPSVSPTVNPTASPTVSPSVYPTMSPTNGPTSSPTSAPSTAPTLPQCEMSISTTGGDGLTWDVTDDEGDEEIASGDFGGEAMDFTLLASEEYLLFLSSDTVPAGTSITVTVNGQDTVIPLEQGLTTSTEIAGVTCEAISNKIASIDSAYSSTSVLLALLMVLI